MQISCIYAFRIFNHSITGYYFEVPICYVEQEGYFLLGPGAIFIFCNNREKVQYPYVRQ